MILPVLVGNNSVCNVEWIGERRCWVCSPSHPPGAWSRNDGIPDGCRFPPLPDPRSTSSTSPPLPDPTKVKMIAAAGMLVQIERQWWCIPTEGEDSGWIMVEDSGWNVGEG